MSAKAITKLLSMIIAGTQSLSGANADTPDAKNTLPARDPNDVWATIERISQAGSPNAIIRVQLAQQAGQSELAAALAQSVRTCTGNAGECITATINRLGGLTMRNLVSIEALTRALESVGVPTGTISEALDAYSTAVAEAVNDGEITEQYAAATLADEAAGSLYF